MTITPPVSRAALGRIPLNDLSRRSPTFQAKVENAIGDVLTRGWYVLGPNVREFEVAFARYCGVQFCAGVASGSDALELALRAVGVRAGDEVVTVGNAGMYSTMAILAVDARPIFADVEPVKMTMDPASLNDVLTSNTAAVIVTHLYGQLANLPELLSLARQYEIPLIEDCAQAHGSERNGYKAGALGDIGCFSFYPTKNLGAFGDAGAVITNDSSLAKRLFKLRQYGWERKYFSESYGRNSRLDELQAAVLNVKLPFLDGLNERRRNILREYSTAACDSIVFSNGDETDHVVYLCVARCSRRNELREHLSLREIETEIHYPVADYRQPILQSLGYESVKMTNTDKAIDEVLTLPCFPELSSHEITRVCEALNEFK